MVFRIDGCVPSQTFHFGSDTYMNRHSALAARLSCGGLLQVTHQVVTGAVQCGVALVRPPGHHAEPDNAMGFCLFNNVGVAAQVGNSKRR